MTELAVSDIARARLGELVPGADCCDAICGGLLSEATVARGAGRIEDATVFKEVGQACTMMLHPSNPNTPFRALWESGAGRSALPEDFSDEARGLFRSVLSGATNPDLTARLNDILWIRERDVDAARRAIDAYLDCSEQLAFDIEHERVARAIRGLSIAMQLGDRLDAASPLVDRVLRVGAESTKAGQLRPALDLVAFLVDNGIISGEQAIDEVTTLFGDLSSVANITMKRAILELKARIYRGLKKPEEAKTAIIAAAETLLSEADQAIAPLAKQHFTQQAIHKLRTISGYKSDPKVSGMIERLKASAMDMRDGVLASMTPIESDPVDISESVRHAIETVSNKDAGDAIIALAGMFRFTDPDQLRASAKAALSRSILGSLFGATHLGSDGRTTGRTPGGSLGETGEPELEAEMLKLAGMHRQVCISAVIEPARDCITRQHYLSERDLLWLFDSNPLAPPGHEPMLLRGILEGFRGDFLAAGNYLLPQVEHFLRHQLNARGVVTTGFDKDGIEDQVPLDRLIELASEHGFTDAKVSFDLRTLLCEKTAENLRNEHAHGLMPASAYYTTGTAYLWAMMLRMLCTPELAKRAKQASDQK